MLCDCLSDKIGHGNGVSSETLAVFCTGMWRTVEKNWSPFVYELNETSPAVANALNEVPFRYEGRLMVSYSLNPHIVLEVDTESGRCQSERGNPK